MKKQITISVIIAIVLISLFLIIKPSFTGEAISFDNKEKIKLGYCPTMYKEAVKIAEENDYELVKFGSASDVLNSLNKKQINKALIGRKAEQYEINPGINEKIIESGYTLVSNEKSFVSYSELDNLEIHTYLPRDIVNELIPENSQVNYLEKEEVSEKIKQGETALISWEDWKDNFELTVVVNGNEKVRDFRGVFLYES